MILWFDFKLKNLIRPKLEVVKYYWLRRKLKSTKGKRERETRKLTRIRRERSRHKTRHTNIVNNYYMHYPISKKFLAVKHIDMIKTPTKNQSNISKHSKVIPFLICTHTTTAALGWSGWTAK